MNTTEVCRLCLKPGPDDLVWIFDRRIAEPGNMREVIFITTGVEIKKTDRITQKVCKKCLHITIKMFRFRTNATKNDKELKRLMQFSPVMLDDDESIDKQEYISFVASDKISLHPTLEKVLCENPDVKIPSICQQCDILPSISLDPNDVNRWLRERRKRDLWKQRVEAEQEAQQKAKCSNSESASLDDGVIIIDDALSDTDDSPSKVEELCTSKAVEKRRWSTLSLKKPSPKRRKSDYVPTSISSDAAPYLVKESEDLSLCDVCNKIFESEMEMKVHRRKHTTCPHCSKVLKTVNAKERHVKSRCHVNIKRNLPTIKLIKAECDESLTKKYPEAFKCILNDCNDDKNNETNGTLSRDLLVEIDITDDDVYCISDDDEPSKVISMVREAYKGLGSSKTSTSIKPKDGVKIPCPEVKPSPPNDVSSSSVTSTTANAKKNNPLVPQIICAGDSIINDMDFTRDEVGLVKQLLAKAQKNKILPKPSIANVIAQATGDRMFALKNLVPFLKKYKIPIDVQYGSRLTVKFDSNPPPTSNKKVGLWNPQDAQKIPLVCPTSDTGPTSDIGSIPDSAHTLDADASMTLESLLTKPIDLAPRRVYNGPSSRISAKFNATQPPSGTSNNNQLIPNRNNNQLIPSRINSPVSSLNQQTFHRNLPASHNHLYPQRTLSSSPNQLIGHRILPPQVIMNNTAMQQNYTQSPPVILNSVLPLGNANVQHINLVNQTAEPGSNWVPQNATAVTQNFQTQAVNATYSTTESSVLCGTSMPSLVNVTNVCPTPVASGNSLLCQILSITSAGSSVDATNTSTVVSSNESIPSTSANVGNSSLGVFSNKLAVTKNNMPPTVCSIAPKKVSTTSTFRPPVKNSCLSGPPPTYQQALTRDNQQSITIGSYGVTTSVIRSLSGGNNSPQTINSADDPRSSESPRSFVPTIRVKPMHQLIGN